MGTGVVGELGVVARLRVHLTSDLPLPRAPKQKNLKWAKHGRRYGRQAST